LDLDCRPWAELDGPSLAVSAAALQLMPENIPYLVRAQRLAAIGVALPARPGLQPLSTTRLRALLKHPLISGDEVRAQEDPYEELYVEEIAFHGGPRLVLQGLTSHSAHTARMLLQAIFGSPPGSFPERYVRESRLLAEAVLSLSHAMCCKADLRRGLAPARAQHDSPVVPGRARLAELRSSAMFTVDELHRGLPDAVQTLQEWITEAGGHRLDLGSDVTDNGLVVRPLLRHGSDVIVANPGELASALRHHLIILAESHGCRESLAEAFRRTAAGVCGELLTHVQALPRGTSLPGPDPFVLLQAFDGASGTIIDVGVLTDDLADYDPDQPFGYWNIPNAGRPLQDALDPPGPARDDDERTLRLAVTDDVARIYMIGLEPSRRSGPLLTVPLNELEVMIDLDAQDPLFLWRFAQANERFHEQSHVLEWSVLDAYSIYKKNDYSFYLSDERPPTMVDIEVGSGLSLRAEARRRHDRHHILGPGGRTFVEVMSLYGTETAPIYFCHPRHATIAMAVELTEATVWVQYAPEPNAAVRGFLFTMLEAAAYWIWQLELASPGLAARTAGATGRLRVIITPDDSARWMQVLTGQTPDPPDPIPDSEEEAAASCVSASVTSPEEITVTVLADRAAVLLSGTNMADRQLAAALARALAPGDPEERADALTREIAPAGLKRMIQIARSNDILLVPSEVSVRTVQPAVTATTLDDLGRWLTSQGLSTGPITSDARTRVLGQAVEYHFQRLGEIIAGLSSEGLMSFLLSQDEALLHDNATRAQRLPSQLACFGPNSLRAQDLLADEGKSVQAAVASRYLIEYAAATPPEGSAPINLMIYDDLLAIAAELISRATLSDAIHYGFAQVELSMLPSGRLGISLGDRYAAGTRAVATAEAETRHAQALEPVSATDTPQPEDSADHPAADAATRTRVDEAVRAEFGFTLTQVIDGLAALASISSAGESDQHSEPVGQVRSRLGDLPGWDEGVVEAFLGKLTLRPRSNFLSPGPDVYPWRYNRDLSYIRRPLVEITGPSGEPWLLWGPRRTWFAARYWTELVFAGRLKGTTQAMKTLMGTIRQNQNKAFERDVEMVLCQSGMPVTANTVKRIGGQRLLSSDGADLGDIDAIALDPDSKIVVVAEAKDFELARTPAELANEAEALLVGEKSAVHKLGRRADWVHSHMPIVLRHFAITGSAAGWKVLPVIVTSRKLISPSVLTAKISVVSRTDLPSWVGAQRSPGRRRSG
jgi:hypothetical protein